MKITDIREATVSDRTKARNAGIGFSSMTASALVVETDRIRAGAPLRGLAFDSVGRYAHGALLRERFIPRLLAAKPDDYLDETGENIDPAKVWTILMRDEKGRRSRRTCRSGRPSRRRHLGPGRQDRGTPALGGAWPPFPWHDLFAARADIRDVRLLY
jgi:hypothetical protein